MDPALQQLIDGNATDEIEVIARLKNPLVKPDILRVITQFDTIVTGRIERGAIYTVWADDTIASLKASRSINLAKHFDKNERRLKNGKRRFRKHKISEAIPTRKVVVGIADWGFDFTHPNFRNKDGSTRFLAIWDQAADYDGKNIYGYGKVHTQKTINKALKASHPFKTLNYYPFHTDAGTGTHGTHVLDIAAGNGTKGELGNASTASLVAVHLGTSKAKETFSLGDQSRLLESIHFMDHIANETPLVINLSVGSHGDAHRGLTLVEQALDKFLVQKKGRAIVQSVGNYFTTNTHASGRITHGGKEWLTWKIPTNDSTENELEIWYSGRDTFRVSLFEEDVERAVSSPNENSEIYNEEGVQIGKIYHRTNEPNTGLNHVDIFLYENAKPPNWKLKIEGINVVDGRFNSWIERDGSLATQSRFSTKNVDTETTLGTICNGHYTIAVGAYDDLTSNKKIARFSSSGPTSDGRIKPDLVAPGVNIVAARSAKQHETTSKGELTVKSGTSMAAPFVAGAVARMFQEFEKPLSIQDTRKLLFRSIDAPSESANKNRLGNGYINLSRLLNHTRIINNKRTKIMRTQTGTSTPYPLQNNGIYANNAMDTYTARIHNYVPNIAPLLEQETSFYQETIPSSGLTWNNASPAQIAFMRQVYNTNLQRSLSRGTFVADVPNNQLATVEGRYQLRTPAAQQARQMLAALRGAIRSSNIHANVGLTSAYRSASHQFNLWNRYFIRQYYNETRSRRQALPGGEHGAEAVRYLASYVRRRIATPGFSNHNNGLAIDIRNEQNGQVFRNRSRTQFTGPWRRTWIWNWLIANAATYNFHQNTAIDEPWHWEYRGPLTNSNNRTTQSNSTENPVRPWNNAVKTQWINEKILDKTFLQHEPNTNICLLPFPEWVNLEAFQNNFIHRYGEVANEMLGDPTSTVTADYFVIHDTAGTRDITRARAARKGVHLWLNIENAILAKDWGERGSGVKIERGNNGCFVHTELVRHPQLDTAISNIKDGGTYYTYRQYELLALAYIICSIRKGRLLEVTIHREVDRSVEYRTSEGLTTYGHGDPKHFNIDTFYSLVNSFLQMPTTDYTYGIQHSRVMAQNQSNRAGFTNAFIPYVENIVNRANQYGAIEHRTNPAGQRIRGNYLVNNIRVRRRC